MTLAVLNTATSLALRTIQKEVEAARDERLIGDSWARVILANQHLLKGCIQAAIEDSEAERGGSGGSMTPGARRPLSLDSEHTMVMKDT